MDGFERFAHGQLITLFSATNYCGMYLAPCSVLKLCIFFLRSFLQQVLRTMLGPYLWLAGA
jgi:hypothetical protein